MNKIIYGAAYYREYMPYERLDQDLQLMKQAGMNTIRIAESTWSTMEPKDGYFDFATVDAVLDKAEELGINVIIGTPTYAIPSWLANKDDTILADTPNGMERYGRRQNMDITNETYLFHAERMIRKLAEHVSRRSCVIGYQIDNETKHYQTSGKRVQQMFLYYLKDKFVTPEQFNQAYGMAYWSNAIHSWEDIPDVRGTINAGFACEFSKFQRKLVTDFLCWQSEIIMEYKHEDQFVTHNLDFEWKKFGPPNTQEGYSYGVQPDVDHKKVSNCLSIAGTDIYHMSQDKLTGAEIAFGGDLIRSLKKSNYLVLETQAQAFKYWTPYEGQLRIQAYSHLASGADGVMYWNWHSIHNSFETYWKGILSHDLQPNQTYREIKDIGLELEKIGEHIIHIKKETKVALLVSNEALSALKWFPVDENLTYNNIVRWMYDTLYEMNIECDIIFPEDDFSNYQMLVVPALYTASETLLYRLKNYMELGGCLVSSFKTGFCNENLSVYHSEQPHILGECMGFSYDQFSMPDHVKLQFANNNKDISDDERDVSYWMELLRPTNAQTIASYEHKYWGKYSAIVANNIGKGYGYYIGCHCSKKVLGIIFEMAADRAGVLIDKKIKWPLICRKGRNQSGQEVRYYFNYDSSDIDLQCPEGMWQNILNETTYQGGDLIALKDWGTIILCRLN